MPFEFTVSPLKPKEKKLYICCLSEGGKGGWGRRKGPYTFFKNLKSRAV